MRLTAREVPIEDKRWGVTRCLFKDDSHEVWHASPKTGGYSSRHRHHKMPNKFYLVSGVLQVEVYEEKPDTGVGPLYVVTIEIGQEYTVNDGVWHRFLAMTDCELIEIYWTHIPEGGDIERTDMGGIMVLPLHKAA